MADRIHLQIVTAGGVVFDRMVHAVNLPLESGSIGVLADHAPLIGAVVDGAVTCASDEGEFVIAVGIGTIISLLIDKVLTMPAYIGAMLAAAVIRNVADGRGKPLPMAEITSLGNVCLSLFLALAMINLKLWQLIDLALPMIVLLLVQTVIMFFYASFVVFTVMGKDYDAATMSSGFCGFGMGATPNAMANMQAVTKLYGPAPVAFMIVPLVGSLFIDFFNAAIITAFANFLA